MEQHQVPRNIAGFQFHLIGDMTLKQFAYLASGAALAYFIFRFAPFPSMVNIIFAGFTGLTGLAFAFFPIQERPLDRWLIAFIKSVYSPTQYVWQKEGIIPNVLLKPPVSHIKQTSRSQMDNHKYAKEKLRMYLASLPSTPHQVLNDKEKQYIEKTMSLFGSEFTNPVPVTTRSSYSQNTASSGGYIKIQNQAPFVKPSVIPTLKTHPTKAPQIPSPPIHDIQKPVQILQTANPSSQTPPILIHPIQEPVQNPPKITTSQTKETSNETTSPQLQHVQADQPNHELADLKNKLSSLSSEKDQLLTQLNSLKKELQSLEKPNIIKPLSSNETKRGPTIKTITGKAEIINELGLPNLPQTPNLIIGVVKDSQNKFLPNIIITIKDSRGIPLRAFKTNKLGQFASATPLPNGTYLLELEDTLKRYIFDIAQITLSGKIFLPIEVIAKGEKEILREKLNKELFGNPNL